MSVTRGAGADVENPPLHTNWANSMNAIKKVRMYMQKNPTSREAKVLGRLAAALAEEQTFPLAELYSLDLDAFDLALELMADWRLDRYYSARLKLLDTILAEVRRRQRRAPRPT